MKYVIAVLMLGLVGCGVNRASEIELKDGRKYRCDAIWGDEHRVHCYLHAGAQSFTFETRQVRWFTSHSPQN